MKSPIIFVLFLLSFLLTSLSAQPAAIQKLANLTADPDDRSELSLSGSWLAGLFKDKDGNRKGYLDRIHLISTPKTSGVSVKSVSEDLSNKEGFELLTSFRNGKDQGNILIREKGTLITDLVLLFQGDEEKITAITVAGKFTIDDLEAVDLDINGWSYVQDHGQK